MRYSSAQPVTTGGHVSFADVIRQKGYLVDSSTIVPDVQNYKAKIYKTLGKDIFEGASYYVLTLFGSVEDTCGCRFYILEYAHKQDAKKNFKFLRKIYGSAFGSIITDPLIFDYIHAGGPVLGRKKQYVYYYYYYDQYPIIDVSCCATFSKVRL